MPTPKYFVDFNTLRAQLYAQETGVLREIIDQYMGNIAKVKLKDCFSNRSAEEISLDCVTMGPKPILPEIDPPSMAYSHPDETWEERYYLPIPWYQCYAGSIMSYSSDNLDNELKTQEWLKENQKTMDHHTELPMFASDYTFENYFQSRLKNILLSSISKDQYEKWKIMGEKGPKYQIILNQDRDGFVVMLGNRRCEFFNFEATGQDENDHPDYSKDIFRIANLGDRVFVTGDAIYCSPNMHRNAYSHEVKNFLEEKTFRPNPSFIERTGWRSCYAIGDMIDDNLTCDGYDIYDVMQRMNIQRKANEDYHTFKMYTPIPWYEY